MSHSSSSIASTIDVSPTFAWMPSAAGEVLLRLLRRHPGPVRERVHAGALRQVVVEPRDRELEGVRVAVVPVEQDDPREADVRQREADVAHEVEKRVHPHVDEAVRAPMVVCDAERDRWPDERLELGRRALRDLERDVHVRPERAVVAVVLGRADRDDDRPCRRPPGTRAPGGSSSPA